MQIFTTKPKMALAITQAITIPVGTTKISAKEYETLVSLRTAQNRVKAEVAQLQENADALREQYRQEGLEQGRMGAQHEVFDCIAQMKATMDNWVENTDTQLTSIVSRCVEEVVTKVDTSSIVQEAVAKGLAEVSTASQIIIKVHPSQVEMVEGNLKELIKTHHIDGKVRVKPEPSFQEGDCVVESPMGFIDLGMKTQLRLLKKAIG